MATEDGANETTTEALRPAPVDRANQLGRKVILGLIVLVVAVVAYLIAAQTVPRWWARRIGDVVDGRLLWGNLFGFVIGFVFTALPLVVLWLGWRFRATWRRAAMFVVLAAIVGAPNLMTLGIVLGNGNAAHAGDRILDVDGPGFRAASLVGAVVAVLVVWGVLALGWSRRRNKRRVGELEAELQES